MHGPGARGLRQGLPLAFMAANTQHPYRYLPLARPQVQLVLEYCDKGCLRDALDAGAFFGSEGGRQERLDVVHRAAAIRGTACRTAISGAGRVGWVEAEPELTRWQ